MTDHPRIDVDVDRKLALPAYRQIHDRIRGAILTGRLAPGARLPSARSLASQLAVARGTVDAAYEALAGEGYVVARGAAGTVVAPGLDRQLLPARAQGEPASATKTGSRGAPAALAAPFNMALPALDAFPRKLWSRLAARRARSWAASDLLPPAPAGVAALRHEVAAYLALARGIACAAEDVIVTAGFQGALGLIARAFTAPGDAAWVEDPGYFLARRGLRAAGVAPVPVPVDADGLDVAAAVRRAPAARLAVVTPAHQSPLGVTLSLARRLALLAWADGAGAWIVEDDYDSEYRYAGRPLPALKSLDGRGRVLYVGTFSKVLFPGLRLGYLVAPAGAVEAIERAASLQPGPSALVQQIVADFMANGHFARHIRRMRGLYEGRRQALAAALAKVFGATLEIEPPAGGMHLLGWLAKGADDALWARRAAARGLAPAPLSRFAVEAPLRPGLALGFTNVEAATAERAATALRRACAGD